jgi:hypothetical protein
MTQLYRYAFFAAATVTLASATGALAADVRTKDPAGFSEISVPQVKGNIPFGRLPAASDAKSVNKANSSQTAPNQPVRCGPENAQSEACRQDAKGR